MIPPWSHTMLSAFGNCMWKGFRTYIAKDLPREEKSPEQLEGTRVHELFGAAINKPTSDNWSALGAPWVALVSPLANVGAKAEFQLAVSEAGGPAPYWPKPWGRAIVDVIVRQGDAALLVDWKTGKVREDPRELMAQSFAVKANFPEIKKVTGVYAWLKEGRLGQVHDLTNTDRWLAGTKALLAKCEEAEATGHWDKQPNPLCGWCPVKDCEHNRS